MEYKIDVRNHWWFDGGIAGLYFIADRVKREKGFGKINIDFDSTSLYFKGESIEAIRAFLKACYENLASEYWNVSTKEQKERNELVFYNPETEEFSLGAKRQATPVVSNFVKGTSWKAEGINYAEMDEKLRESTSNYLKETGRKLWGKQEKLLYSSPVSHAELIILPEENSKNCSVCSICGKNTRHVNNISQPSFLLFASSNAAKSFHTQGKKPAKICWECELISRFTMETISYKKEGTSLSVLLLNSSNLKQNIDNQRKIGSSSVLRAIDKDYYFRNIGLESNSLINKAKKSYELLWAFFIETYQILKDNSSETQISEDDFLAEFLGNLVSVPMEIIIMNLEDKGQTFITKELIFYNDISYAYRLIHQLVGDSIDIKRVFYDLLEKDSKGNEKATRNNILGRILNKHCILLEIESLTFRKSISNKYIDIKNMLLFLRDYYLVIKEDIMNKEQIEIAVKLGKQIVTQPYIASNKNKDVLKKIRGDLFALRKTRTVTDFITQLNTLQFRYGISVSNSVLEGILNEVPFEDFKGYCIMGALNNYNFYNSSSVEKGDKENE